MFTKLLAVFLILSSVLSYPDIWKQKGTWISNYNQSNIFENTLATKVGVAQFKCVEQKKIILLHLKDRNQSLNTLQMAFSIYNFSKNSPIMKFDNEMVDFNSFKGRFSSIFSYNHLYINSTTFNITLYYRRKIELSSKEGKITITFNVDLQKQFPFIHEKLWLTIILVLVAVQFVLPVREFNFMSVQILLLWVITQIYSICEQVYYLIDNQSKLLIVTAILTLAFLITQYFFFIIKVRFDSKADKFQCSKRNFIGTIVYLIFYACIWFDTIQFKLWHILMVANVFQLLQSLEVSYKQNYHVEEESVRFLIIYLFPICLFPLFSIEINYPKEEADLWLVYVFFYLLEIGINFLKRNGGIAFVRRSIIFAKRIVNFEEYRRISQNLCPICFTEVQINDSDLSVVRDLGLSNWVKLQCQHYSHKKCFDQNIKNVKICNFDNKEIYNQVKQKEKQRQTQKMIQRNKEKKKEEENI